MYSFLIMTTLISHARALSCSNELKQGPFKLEIPKQTLPNITRLELSINKWNVTEPEQSFIIGYRSRWTSYCYNGGALDPNTGCFNSLIPYPPNQDELQKWSRTSQCETCIDYSDAWGSDSSKCLEPMRACGKWQERKELQKESTNNHFAYHTCSLSWRCGISTSKAPVILKFVDDFAKVHISLPNGTLKQSEKFFHYDGQTSIYLPEEIKVQVTRLVAKCVEEEGEYWCIDPDSHTSIRFNIQNPEYCLYGNCYQWAYTTEKKKTEDDYKLKHASLEDLKSVFVKEMLEIEDLKYTVLKIAHRAILLEEVLKATITSLAKIDDKLIPKILKGSFSTEFLNEEAFFIRPCLRETLSDSNCIGNKIFRDGRWVINSNKANCISLKNLKPINLFEALDIWLPEVSEQKAQGTADDYTGWSFYANSRDSLTETMQYTRNGGKGTSLQDVLDLPGGALARTISSLMGLSLTGIVFSIGVVIVLSIICRRL